MMNVQGRKLRLTVSGLQNGPPGGGIGGQPARGRGGGAGGPLGLGSRDPDWNGQVSWQFAVQQHPRERMLTVSTWLQPPNRSNDYDNMFG